MTETRQQPTWLMNDFDFENHMGIGMRTAETIARAERAARIAAEIKRDELADLVVRYAQAELPEAINDLAYDRDKHFKRAEAAEAKIAAVEAERDRWRQRTDDLSDALISRAGDIDRLTKTIDELHRLVVTAPAGGERNEGDT